MSNLLKREIKNVMVKGQGCEDCAVKYVLGKPGCKTTGVIKYWNVRLGRDLGGSLAYLSNGRQCGIVGKKKKHVLWSQRDLGCLNLTLSG